MKVGIIFGTWDILHAGHIHLLREAKKRCDWLVVGIHVNPKIERRNKNKPIETLWERTMKLTACKFVDVVTPYEYEYEIPLILTTQNVDVRFLGSDYKGTDKPITAKSQVPIEYIDSIDIHTSDIRKRLK